jgi:diguanylate cyclase (GGDEF)-like protein
VNNPEQTLLVVLQLVTLVLTLLLLVGARQAHGREGARCWLLGFAVQPITQFLRQIVAANWGHFASLPFGHAGGVLAYALVYIGTRYWLGLKPRHGFAATSVAGAAICSIVAASQGLGYLSLALTTCFTAMFEALIAFEFYRFFRRRGGLVRITATVVFAVSALASLGRAYSIVPGWHSDAAIMPVNSVWLLVFIALCILQAGSLLNLINQSLLDELRSLADFDSLTGLLNRGGLSRRMRHRRLHDDGTPPAMAMICLDLDHFKSINDTHGHGAGDDVLRAMGKLLQENARPNDLSSRTGGEEFGMVLDVESERALLVFAERLRALIERTPFNTRAGAISVTTSVGAAYARGNEEALEAVWERADNALLEAKRAGRNRVLLGVHHAT